MACVALASVTGWQLSELMELDSNELLAWLEACKKISS
jgi:hypothetical protein